MDPLSFACQLANQAGSLLLEYHQSGQFETTLKFDRSVVTTADLAADNLIHKAIKKDFPQDLLISEELLPNIIHDEGLGKRAVWIIDPLDGTTNYSLGLHIWGVLIARLVEGLPEMAVLYFPALDELYTVQRGQGAFLNGNRIQVQPPSPENPLSFFACCSRTFRRFQVSVPYKARILGSAAYSFCTVARGMSVLGFEATTKIWDIAGAWLLVEEAGGAITTLNGAPPFPLRPDLDYSQHPFPTLAAASGELMEKAKKQIVPR